VSATRLDTWPYFTITKSGVQYAIPAQATVQRDGTYRPVPVARNPKIAFPPPLATANPDGSAARRNYDIDEVIFTGWPGGMGTDTYPPNAPPSGFQWSRCDTRWPGVLVGRPLATKLGVTKTLSYPYQYIHELDYTNARLLWAIGSGTDAALRLDSVGTWQTVVSGANNLAIYAVSRGLNGVMAAGDDATGVNSPGIFRTSDGVTWEKLAKGAIATAIWVAEFDDRVWTLSETSSAGPSRYIWTAYSSTDAYTAAAGAVTWTAGNSFHGPPSERPTRLFPWIYPPDKGRTTLWCQTNFRLLYYDYYAATPAWVTWHQFRPANSTTVHIGWGAVWGKNNNLYSAIPDVGPVVWEFTGNTITPLAPNKGGGLPAGFKVNPVFVEGNGHHLFVWGNAPATDSGSKGATLAMAEGGAFHHLLDDATRTVIGGGAGRAKLYTILQSGANAEVYEQVVPDEDDLPQYATGRTYDAGALVHRTGWINGGLVNVNKRALYVEIDCLKDGGTVGLNTGATLKVEIVTRAATTNLGTLTDASTFPAVLEFAGGIACKEFQVQLTLTRGTATSATPFVRAIKVGYRPRPKQRYTYTLRADVRDDCPAFDTANGLFRGHSASFLRQFLDEVGQRRRGPGRPAGGPELRREGEQPPPALPLAPQCEVLTQGQESVEEGRRPGTC
jgi:hypothetical protein